MYKRKYNKHIKPGQGKLLHACVRDSAQDRAWKSFLCGRQAGNCSVVVAYTVYA